MEIALEVSNENGSRSRKPGENGNWVFWVQEKED